MVLVNNDAQQSHTSSAWSRYKNHLCVYHFYAAKNRQVEDKQRAWRSGISSGSSEIFAFMSIEGNSQRNCCDTNLIHNVIVHLSVLCHISTGYFCLLTKITMDTEKGQYKTEPAPAPQPLTQ